MVFNNVKSRTSVSLPVYKDIMDSLNCCDNPEPSTTVVKDVSYSSIDVCQLNYLPPNCVIKDGRVIFPKGVQYIEGICDNCYDSYNTFVRKKTDRFRVRCKYCLGQGATNGFVYDLDECVFCDGTGWIHRELFNRVITNIKYYFGCDECGGEGSIPDMYAVPDEGEDLEDYRFDCDDCDSKGYTVESVREGLREFFGRYKEYMSNKVRYKKTRLLSIARRKL